jgi:hypothetical protein
MAQMFASAAGRRLIKAAPKPQISKAAFTNAEGARLAAPPNAAILTNAG